MSDLPPPPFTPMNPDAGPTVDPPPPPPVHELGDEPPPPDTETDG